jgi:ribosome-associated protein
MNKSSTENDTLEISKSQRKREAHELLDLAKKLISMPKPKLVGLPMDQDLRDEVEFTRSIRAHGARKRQLMTVGKMLRKRDTGPLTDAVNNIDQKNRRVNARFHHIETWRDRLIEGNDQALSELFKQIPDINVQTLRQLIRNAQKEVKLGKPPVAVRKLFKLLRDTDKKSPLPPFTNSD